MYTSATSVIFMWLTATATQQLLHLERDCGLHFIDFGHHVLIVSQQGRELASLSQAWAQYSWDLLDQRL